MPQVSLTQLADVLGRATVAGRSPGSVSEPVLACFPTDTVPALAAVPAQADLIYTAKRRTPEKPLILMGASLEDLLPYVEGDADARRCWQALTQQHWPGQLTLVLPASDRTPAALNPMGTGTLGIRVPNHPLALALLTRTGPLATTSANLSGQPPLTKIDDIARVFPTALILPAAATGSATDSAQVAAASGMPSTVALWTGSGQWKILRQGTIQL
ncbi:MAG: L-threonylcarbamoyladenylate synthase [Cyanobacteria bacterium J06598_3]